jgi:hypothetical protein
VWNWRVKIGSTVLATFPTTPASSQHIEVTREGGAYSVWLDNALVAGPTSAPAAFIWGGFHVGITSGGGSHYLGLFGDVTLTDVVAHSPQAKIKTFGLPGMPATIDETAKTIYWPVTYVSDPAVLAAEFTISDGAKIYDGDPGAGGTEIASGAVVRDFTNPVHYWVKSSDDAILSDYTVTVYHTPISSVKDILTFGPANNRAVISGTNITWSVPYGMPLETLAPEYTVSQYFGGSATGSPATGTAPDPSFAVANPATYTITAQDGTQKQYYVTVNSYPEWPTLINVNYSGGANGNLNGLYSFDAVARGNAASVAPANYAGTTWTDATSSTASGSNLKDSQGNTTSVGFTTSCNAGPWGDWNMLGAAKISHAAAANYTAYQRVFALNGLNPGHKYDIYVASSHNNQNKPADWQVGTAVKNLANTPTESTNWVEGKNFIHFTDLIPLANGTITVNAKGNGEYDGINLNAFQVQDMGVRGSNPEAIFYAFSFPGSSGVSATTMNGTNISVTLYTGTDVTALRPTFTTSAGATVTAADTTVVSGDARNFTSPVHYVVTSEDTFTTTDYTVTVNFIPNSGHVNVHFDNALRTGLYGPAPFSGLDKVWNKTINVKTGSNLLDEDGIPTTIGFNCSTSNGPGAWGNPSLSLLKGAVYVDNLQTRNLVISGLVSGKKYDLYIASYFADGSRSKGSFTTTNTTTTSVPQLCNNNTDPGTAWGLGINYVLFQNVEPDGSNNITVAYTGNGNYAMMCGFQLLDTGIKSPNCDMLTFGPGASISGTNITWTAPYGSSLASLAPTFTTSGLATVTAGGTPVVSGATVNFTAGPVHYIVTAEDGINSKDYTVTATVATPPVASGLSVWYDAGAGVTVGGGVVQSWLDLSGNSRIATQGGGTVTLVPNEVNSRPVVRLRSGGYMNATTVPFTSIVKEQYVVVRSPNATWNGGGSFFGRKSDVFLSVRASSYNMASGTTGFWQDHYPTAVSKNGRTILQDPSVGSGYRGIAPITDYMILKIVVDNDGVGNIGTYPHYQIGKNEGTGTMDFDVAEIIGYNNSGATLSTADGNLVTAYLAQKYGVAVAITSGFSNLTASQSIGAGTSSVTLSGTLSAPGPVYPAAGELVAVTINGVTQNATVSGSAGDFSIVFPTASIPFSVTPYPIQYSYAGNATNLAAAPNHTSTTLTVTEAPVGSPYATWANGTFVPPLTAKLPGDNQDVDSLNNLQEFAFGTLPTVTTGDIVVSGTSVTPGVPKIVSENGNYYIVYGRRRDSAGLTYTVEFTAGLDLWGDNDDINNPAVPMGATDATETIDAMRVMFPPTIHVANGDPKPNFARVRVVLAP